MLQAKERAPTPCSSAVFTSNSHLSLLRSLGAPNSQTHTQIPPLAPTSFVRIEKFPYFIVPPTQTLSSVALTPLITIAHDRSKINQTPFQECLKKQIKANP
jgi:hypothetical protein